MGIRHKIINISKQFGLLRLTSTGGGMLAGGGMSSFTGDTSGAMSQSSHSTQKHDCPATTLCVSSCTGQYTLGPMGVDGCQPCTCHTGKEKLIKYNFVIYVTGVYINRKTFSSHL